MTAARTSSPSLTATTDDLYADGLTALRDGLAALRQAIRPTKRMSVAEWAERYGRIPDKDGGPPHRVRLFGYQKGFLEAVSDPAIRQIAVLKGARVGYTQLMTLALGYFIHHDPAAILMAQPTVDDAKDFAKGEVMEMLQATPVLADLLRPVKKGEAQDTITDLRFSTGATLRLRGAASDDAFRRVTTRVNIGDEVDADGWRGDRKNSQGDKLKLMAKRGATKWNSKTIIGSTPVWYHASLVWREWKRSDQRRYFVPCPHCGEMQFLEWGGADVPHGVKWSKDGDGLVKDVWYVCVNGCVVEEQHKRDMDARGEWRPTAKPRRPGLVGYHMWAGMSLLDGADWRTLVEEWLEACENPAKLLQPFFNLVLGLPYEDRRGSQKVSESALVGRREAYPAEVPDGVVAITVGVDRQEGSDATGRGKRIEASVWGWGRGEEGWLLAHHVIPGGIEDPAVQAELDRIATKDYRKADGTALVPQAVAIDLGGGEAQALKDYARSRWRRNVWIVKGKNQARGARSAFVLPRKPSRKNHDAWYMLDTQLAKDILLGERLPIERAGRGCLHFPMSVDDAFLKGLLAETLHSDKSGAKWWEKSDGKAYGEPTDCLVYAYSALQGVKMLSRKYRNLDRLADALGIPEVEPEALPDEDADETPKDRPDDPGDDTAEQIDETTTEAAPSGRPSSYPAPAPPPAPTRAPRRPVMRPGWMSRR